MRTLASILPTAESGIKLTASFASKNWILVLDDEEAQRRALSRLLRRQCSCLVVSSANIEEAKARILAFGCAPQLAVLDHELEETRGIALLNRLEQEQAPRAYAIYTGTPELAKREASLCLPLPERFLGIFPKGGSPKALLESIHSHLEREETLMNCA